MSRQIDADALMLHLNDIWLSKTPSGTENIETQTYKCAVCEGLRLAMDAVMEAPTVGGWISADKRPPKQGRYLVWGLTQIVPDHNDEPNGYWQTKIAQWFETTGWDCKVKFWQMLPEPPEVSKNG